MSVRQASEKHCDSFLLILSVTSSKMHTSVWIILYHFNNLNAEIVVLEIGSINFKSIYIFG